MIYIHGRTRPPAEVREVYFVTPLDIEVKPVFSGEVEPFRVVWHGCCDRDERSWLKRRGHRNGRKGITLRTHRRQ